MPLSSAIFVPFPSRRGPTFRGPKIGGLRPLLVHTQAGKQGTWESGQDNEPSIIVFGHCGRCDKNQALTSRLSTFKFSKNWCSSVQGRLSRSREKGRQEFLAGVIRGLTHQVSRVPHHLGSRLPSCGRSFSNVADTRVFSIAQDVK